ncbi:hypothetical protein Droror1_Dr00004938 [Drosera rotundifolia]
MSLIVVKVYQVELDSFQHFIIIIFSFFWPSRYLNWDVEGKTLLPLTQESVGNSAVIPVGRYRSLAAAAKTSRSSYLDLCTVSLKISERNCSPGQGESSGMLLIFVVLNYVSQTWSDISLCS